LVARKLGELDYLLRRRPALEAENKELREALAREVQTNIELTKRLRAFNENKAQTEK